MASPSLFPRKSPEQEFDVVMTHIQYVIETSKQCRQCRYHPALFDGGFDSEASRVFQPRGNVSKFVDGC